MRPGDTSAQPTAEDVVHWRNEVAWRKRALAMRGITLETAQELRFEIDARELALRRAEGGAAPKEPRAAVPDGGSKLVLPGSSKLTDEQVRQIRRRYGNGNETRVGLASEFGVTESTIGRVVHRLAYRDVEPE